jgi:hypothetical protein
MISWNECEVQFAKYDARIGRIDRDGWMANSPVARRRHGVTAAAKANVGAAMARIGEALIAVGRWLSAGEQGAEVG